MEDSVDEGSDPGVYSKLDEGVGDGTHFIAASFVKTNEKKRTNSWSGTSWI
jgi:hypothetical protein